jgi:hypothetical protein
LKISLGRPALLPGGGFLAAPMVRVLGMTTECDFLPSRVDVTQVLEIGVA